MMKTSYVIAGLTAFGLIVGAGVGAADAKAKHGGMRGPMIDFSAADTDGDGKLTREELAAHAKTRFDAADKDGNGSLSADELKAQVQERAASRMAQRSDKMATRMIERMDANDDGEIAFDEMAGQKDRAGKMFERMDKDGDGAISAEEHAAMPDGMRRGKFGKRGDHGYGHGHGQKKGDCQSN